MEFNANDFDTQNKNVRIEASRKSWHVVTHLRDRSWHSRHIGDYRASSRHVSCGLRHRVSSQICFFLYDYGITNALHAHAHALHFFPSPKRLRYVYNDDCIFLAKDSYDFSR